MEQDENEQNYKKGTTPVVGKKPNGKSRFGYLGVLMKAVFLWLCLALVASIHAESFLVTNPTDSTNVTSLRGAIIAANALGGVNTIVLSNAVYDLTISNAYQAPGLAGALAITNGDLVIVGSSYPSVVIEGSTLGDRLFNVYSNAQLTLVDLVLTSGSPAAGQPGGGIYNSGTLTLENCLLVSNVSGADGGGLYNVGFATLSGSLVESNSTAAGDVGLDGGAGGGIYNAGNCVVISSVLAGNNTGSGGQGAYYDGDGGNGGSGSAVYNSGLLTLDGCVVSSNFCGSGGNSGYALGNGGLGGSGAIANSGTMVMANSLLSVNVGGVGGRGSINGAPSGQGGDGGALYNVGGQAVLSACVISNNVSGKGGPADSESNGGVGGDGGGVFNASFLILSNTVVCSNWTGAGANGSYSGGAGGNGGHGGGVYNSGDAFFFSSSVLANAVGATGLGNLSTDGGDGGGVWNSGTMTLFGSTIAWNAAASGAVEFLSTLWAGTGGNGGGVYNAGSLTLTECTIAGNSAGTGGAGTNQIIGFASNAGSGAAGGNGGGICNQAALSLVACTVNGNAAGSGGAGAGGGYLDSGGGSGGAGGAGGGIYTAANSTSLLRNSLVALNSSGFGGAAGTGSSDGSPGVTSSMPDLSGVFVSQGFNLVGACTATNGIVPGVSNDISGTVATPLDPRLGSLQPNGGATLTFDLLSDSPAIDAGDDSLLSSPINLALDQRGEPRLSGDHVDIGAVEYDGINNGGVAPPRLTSPVSASPGIQFWFNGCPGLSYSVWASTNLATWFAIGSASEVSRGWFFYGDTGEYSHLFYQVRYP